VGRRVSEAREESLPFFLTHGVRSPFDPRLHLPPFRVQLRRRTGSFSRFPYVSQPRFRCF